MQFLKNVLSAASVAKKEYEEVERFFSDENKVSRRIVFYAERAADYRYYRDFVEEILNQSKGDICYLTSDIDDSVFKIGNPRLKVFFVQNMLASVMSRLDADVLVMTTPDLNAGIVKRAPEPVQHLYVFHGVASVHQQYRKNAFDFYDSILCVAPYQKIELEKIGDMHGLKPRQYPIIGYPYIERIHADHKEIARSNSETRRLNVLVAPTWDPNKKTSLLTYCVDPLIETIGKMPVDCTIRPHPEYVKRFPKSIESIKKMIATRSNVSLEEKPTDNKTSLHNADVLITDHSSICFDFFIGTERPVIFINTPPRVDNEEMESVGMEPTENKYRGILGAELNVDEIATLATLIPRLVEEATQPEFKEKVERIRGELISNWGESAKLGAQYILSRTTGGV